MTWAEWEIDWLAIKHPVFGTESTEGETGIKVRFPVGSIHFEDATFGSSITWTQVSVEIDETIDLSCSSTRYLPGNETITKHVKYVQLAVIHLNEWLPISKWGFSWQLNIQCNTFTSYDYLVVDTKRYQVIENLYAGSMTLRMGIANAQRQRYIIPGLKTASDVRWIMHKYLDSWKESIFQTT